MDFNALTKALVLKNSTLTLTQNTLDKDFKDFLINYYQGQSITLTRARLLAEPGDEQTIVISGTSGFLGAKNLAVTATFFVNAKGKVVAQFKYQLRGDNPKPSDWKFSHSFPKLPKVFNFDTALPAGYPNIPANHSFYTDQQSFLDSLYLTNTYYVTTTEDGVDPEFRVSLVKGINFVSKMRPQGMLGVLETTLGDNPNLILYGTIRVPLKTDREVPLKPLEYVWDRPQAPGIHLQASLEVDLKFGKLALNQFIFRVYSPPSTDWQQANGTFESLFGYAGKIAIPSAEIEIAIAADLEWNLPRALLYANCEGITLGKLTQLLDLAGTGNLTSKLPKVLQKAVDKLETLELMRVSLGISMFNTVVPTVEMVSFTIGFPNLNWQVWGDHFVVDSLSCRFEIEDPFSPRSTDGYGPSFSVMVTGTIEVEGVPITIQADNKNNFTLYAYLRDGRTIPLKKLMKTYLPKVSAPGDLTVDTMAVTIAPGNFYGMSATLAGQPKPWEIPLGKSKMLISDVVLNFTYPKGGPVGGNFSGIVAFSNAITFAMAYDIPGSFMIRGNFPQARLSNLIGTLCNQKVSMPKGFDIKFESASVLIQRQKISETQSNYVFQCAAEIKSMGSFAFEARKVGSQWGFASGVSLRAGLSDVPGLSSLSSFEKVFQLQKFVLVVSSFDNPAFQFPDLAQFNNPQITAKNIALPGRGGVVAGLNVFAEWRINTKDKKQKLLQKLLGLDPTLGITLQVGKNPTKDAKFFVRYDSTLNGHPFLCQFGAIVQGSDIGLFLNGTITVKIQKQLQTFDLTMMYVTNGAFLSANMSGTTAVKFGPFKLSNLAMEIGVSWQGVPSLGIAATLNISKFQSSMAVFFDSKNPAQSLVAGSVSDLTLKDVVDTLVGKKKTSSIDKPLAKVGIQGTQQFNIDAKLADDLDQLKFDQLAAAFRSQGGITIPSGSTQLLLVVAKKGKLWYLTDKTTMRYYQLRKRGSRIEASTQAQFYCAPIATYIGTKRFPQGYFINGAIQFLGFDAFVRIDISMNKGIAFDSQMDKIIVGNENIFSITAAKGKGGPRISAATFSQPKHEVKAFRLPHFSINGRTQMLGVAQALYASLTSKGLEFDLEGPLAPAVNFDVKVVLNGSQGLDAGGKVKVRLGTINLGKLGKVKIKTVAEGILKVKVSGKTVGATVKGTFPALGKKYSTGTFKLNMKTKALTNLAETMAQEAAKVLKEVFKDAEKWADAVGKDMVEGVDDAEKVLKDVYKKTAKETDAIARKTGVKKAAKVVSKAAGKTGKTVSKGTKKAGKSVAKDSKKAAKKVKGVFK